MALIELDLEAPPEPPPRRPPARWYRRRAGLALAAVLVAGLGGAAPATSTLWQPLGVVPLDDVDSRFFVTGGGVYTVEPAPDGRWTTAAWAGPKLRRTWSVTTGEARAETERTGYGAYLVAADGALLIHEGTGTTVVDPGTGRVRWTAPGQVLAVGPGRGLTQETTFRPGTEYNQAGGAPGELYISSTGQPHTEPPRRTTLHGVDLATGRRLWTSELRGSVRTAPAAGDSAGLVVVSSDRIALLAADTGAVLRSTPLPAANVIGWVDFIGDLVLVRRGRWDRPATLSAYSMDTLALRWQTDDLKDSGDFGYCFGLPCGNTATGRVVLDSATGRPAWRTDPGVSPVRRGDAVVELSANPDRPLRIRDLASGAVRAEIPSWEVVNRDGDGTMVVRRAETDRRVTAFGALLPGVWTVRPLGVSTQAVDECVADERLVACRSPAGLEVWSYRS